MAQLTGAVVEHLDNELKQLKLDFVHHVGVVSVYSQILHLGRIDLFDSVLLHQLSEVASDLFFVSLVHRDRFLHFGDFSVRINLLHLLN